MHSTLEFEWKRYGICYHFFSKSMGLYCKNPLTNCRFGRFGSTRPTHVGFMLKPNMAMKKNSNEKNGCHLQSTPVWMRVNTTFMLLLIDNCTRAENKTIINVQFIGHCPFKIYAGLQKIFKSNRIESSRVESSRVESSRGESSRVESRRGEERRGEERRGEKRREEKRREEKRREEKRREEKRREEKRKGKERKEKKQNKTILTHINLGSNQLSS